MLASCDVLCELMRKEEAGQMKPTEGQASPQTRTMFKHGKANNYLQTRRVETEARCTAPLAWSGNQRIV